MKEKRQMTQDRKIKNVINSNKAITLIALVITIIVLLILAGVTIATLTGDNGILTQAGKAKDKTAEATALEKVQVEVLGSYGSDGRLDLDKLNDNLKNNIPVLTYNGKTITEKEVTDENRIEDLPATVVVDGVKVVIEADGTVTISVAGTKYEKDTTITVGGTKVAVPAKFTISGLQEESRVDNGLVIYLIPDGETVNWNDETAVENAQKTYDQFVWVPVPNAVAEDMNGDKTVDATDIDLMIVAEKYPMAIATGTTTDGDGNTVINYRGILYDFSAKTDTDRNVTGVTISDKAYSATSEYREPAYLTNSSYADKSSYNNVRITQDTLQGEFDTMVAKVASNEGFWVGRYETSNMVTSNTKDTTNKITVKKGTTTGINNVNWYRMYAQQKNYAKLALGTTTTVTSSMIWGSQWDQIMIWMRNIKNDSQQSYYVVNSVGMGNFGSISGVDDGASSTSSPASTGYSNITRLNNIYDLAGNVWEWTLEANSTDVRVWRGASYDGTSSSCTRADYRDHSFPSFKNAFGGSRSSLY